MAEENVQGAIDLGGNDGGAGEGGSNEPNANEGGSNESNANEGGNAGAINLTDEGGEEGKEGGEGSPPKAEEKTVPENYEAFTMPEGFKLADDDNEAIVAFAKESKLSQEEAQKVVDMGATFVAKMQKQSDEAHTNMIQGWRDEIKADAELGGSKLTETQNRANRALSVYGSAKLVEELKRSGYNNNPELVRLLARVDKATGEDNVPNGDGGSPGGSKLSDADKMYPTMK
jgi:hypothetical protein